MPVYLAVCRAPPGDSGGAFLFPLETRKRIDTLSGMIWTLAQAAPSVLPANWRWISFILFGFGGVTIVVTGIKSAHQAVMFFNKQYVEKKQQINKAASRCLLVVWFIIKMVVIIGSGLATREHQHKHHLFISFFFWFILHMFVITHLAGVWLEVINVAYHRKAKVIENIQKLVTHANGVLAEQDKWLNTSPSIDQSTEYATQLTIMQLRQEANRSTALIAGALANTLSRNKTYYQPVGESALTLLWYIIAMFFATH